MHGKTTFLQRKPSNPLSWWRENRVISFLVKCLRDSTQPHYKPKVVLHPPSFPCYTIPDESLGNGRQAKGRFNNTRETKQSGCDDMTPPCGDCAPYTLASGVVDTTLTTNLQHPQKKVAQTQSLYRRCAVFPRHRLKNLVLWLVNSFRRLSLVEYVLFLKQRIGGTRAFLEWLKH